MDPAKLLDYSKLAQQMRACQACDLWKTRTTVVVDRGSPGARLAFVGEAPGAHEDLSGACFAGAPGEVLDQTLRCAGLDPETDMIAFNVLKCVTGDATVTSSTIERGYRRWYEGPLIEIQTSRRSLTGTPNHPVLTDRGWVALGLLDEGSNLVCGIVREGVGFRDPHVEDRPPRFDELLRSLAMSNVRERVVGSHHDFHCDGLDSEIEVVTAHGLLRGRLNSPCFEHDLDLSLEPSDESIGVLQTGASGECPLLTLSKRALSTSTCLVGRKSELLSACRSDLGEAQSHRVRFRSDHNATLEKLLAKPTLSDPVLDRERLERLAGKVTLEKVIQVRRQTFRGHVHNLQTTEGWYTANGVVVSNCRPPGNHFPGDAEAVVSRTAARLCVTKWLDPQFRLLGPQVVVLVGKKALDWILFRDRNPKPNMHDAVGKWYQSPDYPDVDFFVMFPVSYMLRLRREDPAQAEDVEAQIVKILGWAKGRLDGKKPRGQLPVVLPEIPLGERPVQGTLF